MTMLVHTRGTFERTPRSSAARKRIRIGLAAGRLATIKRFCMRVLAVVAAGALLAGIIALEAAVNLSRLNY